MYSDVIEPSTGIEQPKAPQTPAVRLTRRQLAKLEEEEATSKSQPTPSPHRLERDATEDATEGATKDYAETGSEEAIPEVKKDATTKEDSGETETPIAHEELPKVETKPVRLTRRQQAKLEKEWKQSQAKQQSPQPETAEEEVLEKSDAEALPEAVAGQAEELETDNAESEVAPVAAIEEQSSVQEDAVAEPQGMAEKVAPRESQDVHIHATEAIGMETVPSESAEMEPTTPTEDQFETRLDPHFVHPMPEDVASSVETLSEAEPKMLTAEKPVDESVLAPVESLDLTRRISRSPSESPVRIEESISAIDRLEEDLEDIGKAIPDLNQSEDEKSPRKPRSVNKMAASIAQGKAPSRTPAKTPTKASAKATSKTSSKTPSKPPAAAKRPVATKAPPPARISRVPDAAPKSVKPTNTSLARVSSVRAATGKDVAKPSTDTADYLASKRRPISLSFPTPPPPPKGKAPTKPTFQLSSDSVAAKLKAQKQERLKREAEGAAAPKQRPVSMPPPPKPTKPSKPPTVPSFQLPGEATAARLKAQKEERLKRMEEAGGAGKPSARPISMPPPPKSTKPPTKPSFQLPGEATAARLKAQKEERLKRMEEAEAAKKAALAAPVRKSIAHRPRESLLARDASGNSIQPPSNSDVLQRSTSLASKRSSMAGPSASHSTSMSSSNRNSLLLVSGTKSAVTPAVTPVDAVALKVKGKEVFNRDRMEKEAMGRERKEKEEAAKKARAEAAERGRIASREWAERQRKKMMGK